MDKKMTGAQSFVDPEYQVGNNHLFIYCSSFDQK